MITIDAKTAFTLRDQIATSVPQLLSAVVGGGIAFAVAWSTNRSSLARQREQLEFERRQGKAAELRSKGEELFVLIQHWANGLASNYLNFSAVMQGKITYDQALDLSIEAGNKLLEKFNPARMEVLITVYFPDCRTLYDDALTLRDKLNGVHAQFKRSYQHGEDRGKDFLQ